MRLPPSIFIVVLTATPLAGQTLPTMTLGEALDIARERNPEYARARWSIDAAAVGVRAALGAFLPTLSASMSWTGNSNTQLTGSDDFGRTVTLTDPVTVRTSSAQQQISSSLLLFDGLRSVNRLGAARYDVDAARAQVDGEGIRVEAEVTRRFYNAIRFDRLVEVERQLLASAQERLDANQRLFRVAGASQVDVLGARVDLARQEQALEAQRGEARKARLRVLEALGVLDEIVDFEPMGAFPPVFDPSVLDADEVVNRALATNPAVAQRGYQTASASRTASAAKGDWFPNLSLNGGWGRGGNETDFGAFFDVDPSQNRGYTFSLQVRWDLFNGFQRSEQIGRANSQLRQAEEDLRLTTLQVEQAVRAAVIDLTFAFDALETQRRATDFARRRVELAREEYRIGAIPFTSLQQIIDQAASAERELVDAEHRFATARVNLEEQVGERIGPQG